MLASVNVKTGINQPTIHQITDVLPGVTPIDRTAINAWEDTDFVAAVKATGRKKLIMAALRTEVCLVHPALDAMTEGFEVYPVVDAVAGTSVEAHEAGLQRIISSRREAHARQPRRCHMLTLSSAALVNDLPLEFLTRLIWQESRFDTRAISRAGAQGIAQFMPETAAWVGLADPFDGAAAITKSAVLLRSLERKFGNLGLAAAAYNAGPKRVVDWLARRRSLPQETQDYIRIVTGHTADEWTTSEPRQLSLQLPAAVPCPDIVKLFADHRLIVGRDKPTQAAVSSSPEPTWGVQLIGSSSQIFALASFYQLQKRYWTVLGASQPLVLRSQAGRNAYWYRVRIGADSRGDATKLCSRLRSVGGTCLVQPN